MYKPGIWLFTEHIIRNLKLVCMPMLKMVMKQFHEGKIIILYYIGNSGKCDQRNYWFLLFKRASETFHLGSSYFVTTCSFIKIKHSIFVLNFHEKSRSIDNGMNETGDADHSEKDHGLCDDGELEKNRYW